LGRFFGNATIIHGWKRLPEFSAVWAYTPELELDAQAGIASLERLIAEDDDGDE
jgi:hypothetical protein